MSCNYADNLSPYENKGKLGLPEIFDNGKDIEINCQKLAEYFKKSDHTVVHTGAGISTSSGIPDFRGPNGVWTLEKKGEKPSISVSWNDAKPTKTHMALVALQRAGYVSYVVTQNIDGLHLRSGLPRKYLSELHGNLFASKCDHCNRQFVRSEAVETVGLKSQGEKCEGYKKNGRRCRGKLFDTILDWEDSLPEDDLDLAHMHSCSAMLSVCLGTTLQIVPSGNLPVHTKRRGGNLVICNLQPTKQDRYADMIIHHYVDDILSRVLEILGIPLPEYDEKVDPVLITKINSNTKGNTDPKRFEPIDWTIQKEWVTDNDLVNKAKTRKIIKKNILKNEDESANKKSKCEPLKEDTETEEIKKPKSRQVKRKDRINLIKNGKLKPIEALSNINSHKTINSESSGTFPQGNFLKKEKLDPFENVKNFQSFDEVKSETIKDFPEIDLVSNRKADHLETIPTV